MSSSNHGKGLCMVKERPPSPWDNEQSAGIDEIKILFLRSCSKWAKTESSIFCMKEHLFLRGYIACGQARYANSQIDDHSILKLLSHTKGYRLSVQPLFA